MEGVERESCVECDEYARKNQAASLELMVECVVSGISCGVKYESKLHVMLDDVARQLEECL